MAKQRVEYVDYVRGLCVTWVVWYHIAHPGFVDFSFRIPLFFFASGIFFKPYPWPVFWRKKTNQLLVPFVLFYLIYYVWYILSNALAAHSFAGIDYGCIGEVFGLYTYNGGFTINPPLWFIMALIDLQLLLYGLTRLTHRSWLMLAIALAVTIAGLTVMPTTPTPFQLGRSMRYFIYYCAGYVFGKTFIGYIERNASNQVKAAAAAIAVGAAALAMDHAMSPAGLAADAVIYIEIFALIILLIILFKNIWRVPVLYPLKFFGMNSYIVFGMHEIFLSSYRIAAEHAGYTINITTGAIITLLTLLTLWPTILVFNRYIPRLVGKKELIPVPKS